MAETERRRTITAAIDKRPEAKHIGIEASRILSTQVMASTNRTNDPARAPRFMTHRKNSNRIHVCCDGRHRANQRAGTSLSAHTGRICILGKSWNRKRIGRSAHLQKRNIKVPFNETVNTIRTAAGPKKMIAGLHGRPSSISMSLTL